MADNQRCCRTELSLQPPARGQEERGDGAGVALTSVGVQHRLLWQVPDLHAADESEQSAPGTGPAAGQPGWGHSPEVPAAADGLGAAGQDGHRRRDVIVLVFTELVDDEGFLLVQLPQLHGAWGAGGYTTHLRASTHLSGGHPPQRWGGRWAPRGGDARYLPESEATRMPLSSTQRRSATPASVWTPAVQKPSLGARRGSAKTQREPVQQRPLSPEAPSSRAPSAGEAGGEEAR